MIPFYDHQPQQQQQHITSYQQQDIYYSQNQQSSLGVVAKTQKQYQPQQQQHYQSNHYSSSNMKDSIDNFAFSQKLSLHNGHQQQSNMSHDHSPNNIIGNSSGNTTGSGGGGGAKLLPNHYQAQHHLSYLSGDSDSNYDDERLLDEQSHQLQKSLEILSDSDESIPFIPNPYHMGYLKQQQQQQSPMIEGTQNCIKTNNNQQQQPNNPSSSMYRDSQTLYHQYHLPHQINPIIQQPLQHSSTLKQQQLPLNSNIGSFNNARGGWDSNNISQPFKTYDLLPNDFLQQPTPPPQTFQPYGTPFGGSASISSPIVDFNNSPYFGSQQTLPQQNMIQNINGGFKQPLVKQPSPLMSGSTLDWSSPYQLQQPQQSQQPKQQTSPMINGMTSNAFYQSPVFTNYTHSPISSPQDINQPLPPQPLHHQHHQQQHQQQQQQQLKLNYQQQQQSIIQPPSQQLHHASQSNDNKHRPFNPLVAPFQPTKNTAFQYANQKSNHHHHQAANNNNNNNNNSHHHQNQQQQHNNNNTHHSQHIQQPNNNNSQSHNPPHHHQQHQHHQNQQHHNTKYIHDNDTLNIQQPTHQHQHQHHQQQQQQQQSLPQQQQLKNEVSYDIVEPELDHYQQSTTGGNKSNTSLNQHGGSTPMTAPNSTTIELKRGEMVESPISRQQYKHFIKQFKLKEKEGLEVAMEFANRSLSTLSEKVHWRVYLELADLANRQNNLKLARKFYRIVTKTQPYISQGWLEYAKMEEDYGRLEKCQQILQLGLKYCPFNESLLIKGIRHEEKMDNLEGARALLSQLRDQSIFKTWRAVMEGGLLEARAGNIDVARKIFKYLMKHVPWYGPIYQEAYKLEERCEEYDRAIAIVEKGLSEDPKYGPLWFSALRLYEKTSNGYLVNTRSTVERARQSVSREVTWKVYFEAAQIEERSHNLPLARTAYVKSVELCPENLLWKVWLGGSRTELNADNINVARKLVFRALQEVPSKLKSLVLLEYSRLEEYAGNINKSRRILKMAHIEARLDWKVFLESVLLEMRANNYDDAIIEAKESLKIHSGAGRLWAALIQLNQLKGAHAQLKVFKKALQFVPKSGEVWCEGARIALNNNELDKAKRFLEFAVQFTPQFGDSFIELLRLELMEKGNDCDISRLEQLCINADPNYGFMWLHCTVCVLDSPRQVLRNAKKLLLEMTPYKEEYEKTKDSRFGSCWVGATGVLSLNRLFRNDFNKMTNEERRKCLFGSDNVKP